MIDTKGMVFGLIIMFIIFMGLIFLITFSMEKLLKHKESKDINAIYVAIIVYAILFICNNYMNIFLLAAITILVSLVGHIYNYKNKGNKYFISNTIIYSLILIYGICALIYGIM